MFWGSQTGSKWFLILILFSSKKQYGFFTTLAWFTFFLSASPHVDTIQSNPSVHLQLTLRHPSVQQNFPAFCYLVDYHYPRNPNINVTEVKTFFISSRGAGFINICLLFLLPLFTLASGDQVSFKTEKVKEQDWTTDTIK